METNSYSFAKPLLFSLPTISLSHKAACSICPSGNGFKLASQSLSAYCDSPLSVHFRGAERMPWLSCMGAFFKSEDIDTLCFLRVFVLLTVMWPFSCLPLFFCLCLATPPPFVVLVDFIFTLPFRRCHGSWQLEKKATGFSQSTNCCCWTEAVSKHEPNNYQQQPNCVKLSQVVLVRCWLWWLFERGLEALTSIYHLDPIHEKVTLLSLTWFCVAVCSTDQRRNTDPHSVRGQ